MMGFLGRQEEPHLSIKTERKQTRALLVSVVSMQYAWFGLKQILCCILDDKYKLPH